MVWLVGVYFMIVFGYRQAHFVSNCAVFAALAGQVLPKGSRIFRKIKLRILQVVDCNWVVIFVPF